VFTLDHENPAAPGVTNPAETNVCTFPLRELKVAVTVAEPAETAVSTPALDTEAIADGVTLHVAEVVTSLVELSLKVQIAASCTLSPTSNESPGADTLTDWGVGGGGGGITTAEEPPPPQP